MWILTEQGWKQLQPRDCVPAEAPTDAHGIPAPYTGEFPSQDLCEFVNETKERMKYFDDGIRMVYGVGEVQVPFVNDEPLNPPRHPNGMLKSIPYTLAA